MMAKGLGLDSSHPRHFSFCSQKGSGVPHQVKLCSGLLLLMISVRLTVRLIKLTVRLQPSAPRVRDVTLVNPCLPA
jgi:hypothetical protein